MFARVPLSFSLSLDAGGIDQQVEGARSATVRDGDVQCLLTAAQGAEIRNFLVQPGQSKEAFDEPSGLSEGHATTSRDQTRLTANRAASAPCCTKASS